MLYEELAIPAEWLERQMVESHLAQDYASSHEARFAYLMLLEEAGWTEAQFNAETLRRVDAGWDTSSIPSPRGTHPMPAFAGIPHYAVHVSSAMH